MYYKAQHGGQLRAGGLLGAPLVALGDAHLLPALGGDRRDGQRLNGSWKGPGVVVVVVVVLVFIASINYTQVVLWQHGSH